MTVHSTGPYSLIMHLAPGELAPKGRTPLAADDAWTRRVALHAMEANGIGTDGVVEIEAFNGQGGLMIFAALRPEHQQETLFYQFDCLEDLLRLSVRFRRNPPRKSTLTYIDGKYVLSLSAQSREAVRLSYAAGEFGRRLYRPAVFARYLSEHGKVLMRETAAQELTRVFGCQ